jgi:hypothetical protein
MKMNFSDRWVYPFCVNAKPLRTSHLSPSQLPRVPSSRKSSLFRSTFLCKTGGRYQSPVSLNVGRRNQEASRRFHSKWSGTRTRRKPGTRQIPLSNLAAKPSGNPVRTASHCVIDWRRLLQQPEVATFACSFTNFANDCYHSPETARKIGATFRCIRNQTPFKTVKGRV